MSFYTIPHQRHHQVDIKQTIQQTIEQTQWPTGASPIIDSHDGPTTADALADDMPSASITDANSEEYKAKAAEAGWGQDSRRLRDIQSARRQ
nr:hypothetical protein B0A51_14282 [Rachicladosporium sp. CCFEE 5018]